MWRTALILIVAGAALGVAHNLIGLRSRPARGIPWRAAEPELPTLESLARLDSLASAASPPVEPVPPRNEPGRQSHAPPIPDPPKPRPDDTSNAPAQSDTRAASPSPAPPPPPSKPPASVPFIPEMDKPIQITMDAAKRLFDAKAALFLDARDPSEYEEGHIPAAIRLTRDEALQYPDRVKALGETSRPIVAYCDGGACEASLELARVLVDAGYRRVLVYTGGFPEWAAAGHSVVRGSAP